MKILHTSDWHLGRSLYGHKRYQEFDEFLEWLLQTLQQQRIDALLIAGDIFDTGTPSNRAQQLYYHFLARVATTGCQHIVVIAGNHDSPTFLNAPRELLQALNVYVVGEKTENPADEVIVLRDHDKQVQAIICAVPYLRDRDLRSVEAGESQDDKNQKLLDGLRQHYADVCAVAETIRAQDASPATPLIAMGHLFTSGGKTTDGDGVRDLYVGNIAHISKELFPHSIDYFALGHLHVPQKVGGADHIRYCGSPIPMGYGEATQQKQVIVVDFNGQQRIIEEVYIPCFQPLVRVSGALGDISQRINQLRAQGSNAWLEIEYTGDEIVADLTEQVALMIADSSLQVRRIRNHKIMNRVMQSAHAQETLENLDLQQVFQRCLDTHQVSTQQQPALIAAYTEIVHELQHNDAAAD